jgi:cytoskeletal protein CcmA (bactofilin family)
MSEERTKTVIAEDVEIKGTIACTGGIRFEGKLSGDLNCQGIASIGKTAKIEGNITADSATIEGRIAGNVTAKDRIEMKATANVTGDIKAKRLTVEDGVTFVGRSEVNPSGAPAGKPSETPAGAPVPGVGRPETPPLKK